MSQQENRPDDLTAFETALASLAPRVQDFDRERLIFLAGQASMLRSRRGIRWAWPAAFSAMTAVAASLLVMLCIRPEPVVVVESTAPKDAAQGAAGTRLADRASAPVSLSTVESSADREPREASHARPFGSSPWSAGGPSVGYGLGIADLTCDYSYSRLRERMLRQGGDSYWPRPPAPSFTATVAEGPLSYQELLDRLLHRGTRQ